MCHGTSTTSPTTPAATNNPTHAIPTSTPAPNEPDIRVRKRKKEQTGSAGDQLSSSSAEGLGERDDRTPNTEMQEAESAGQFFAKQQEPEMKKQKMNLSEEPVNIKIGQEAVQKSDNEMSTDVPQPVDISALEYRGGSTSIQVAEECCKESITAEHVLGVGTSLKVTIQQSSESRAFSTGLEELAAATATGTPCGVGGQGEDSDRGAATDSHYCYICSNPYHNQQNFQNHMNGLEHQQRMMEIQQVSNACLVNLLPRVGDSLQGTHKAGGKKPARVQRWCATCQTHFTGDLLEHRRTKEHKLSKQSSRPFCTVCNRQFRTPRKFVEHMKSREHKRKVELQEEGEPEVIEELITVDAVGCFEEEDDFEEETHEDEDSRGSQPGQRAVPQEHVGDYEAFDSETQYGSSFVVPVAGFLCRLCHKFFYFKSTARHFHCKSLIHFQNLQKYKALKNQELRCGGHREDEDMQPNSGGLP
ncbi:cdkn1a interacting zinc finger protein 1b isoform X5 [Oncorhynchus keta]|uniref:cdkn1a interacting zinc finger protein 1b isoform X5 n=1 Tax=Oncorhynchus keta TaxID=8018 RepID=UPI0015FD4A76|nr:cdkn1a interacting zinc finger protein 1b isoform X5 [Oncorhynchus keta]